MEKRSLLYAGYWRNSLVDTELARGVLTARDIKSFLSCPLDSLRKGRVDQAIVCEIFSKESVEVQTIEVLVRPKVYLTRLEHGSKRQTSLPGVVAPLVIAANLRRDGWLLPAGSTFVPRDLLEPLEHGSFAIGVLDDLDMFLTNHSAPDVDPAMDDNDDQGQHISEAWAECLAHGERLLAFVSKDWAKVERSFEAADYGYLIKNDGAGSASKHIVALYDHMRAEKPSVPLFERYASDTVEPAEPCLPPNSGFKERLGHSGSRFPLAPAQRDALSHLLITKAGEILAVNGPPGTGKTTMLLSVVATLWAKAALEGGEPPVILAASTNNQAVTNIIDAFSKDFDSGTGPFAGRWLPDVFSFGAYFPSKSKEESGDAGRYQTRSFFEHVESVDYVNRAKAAYLQAAASAYPDADTRSVESVVKALHRDIQVEAEKLAAIETAWVQLCHAREALRKELGDDPDATMAERRRDEAVSHAEQHRYTELLEQWETYLANEPLLYSLLAWLPPVAKKRLRLARLFLRQVWPWSTLNEDWQRFKHIELSIHEIGARLARSLQERQDAVRRGEEKLQAVREQLARWRLALAPLGVADRADILSLAEADEAADTSIRFRIFLLTTHYWEGRWLLDMERILPSLDAEKKKTGAVAQKKRWYRRMKLTPCVVSTFFMLPADMKASRHDGGGFVSDYLYGFADLLIVDEAGQVLPEVAGASFALAKRALVIGDTLQIEPVWSVPSRIDIGNLVGAGLMEAADEGAYAHLSDIGKTAASGSVMRIAQCTTRFHYDPDLARGMFLYEHRRCFDEIIGYCNELCYRNKLIPRRGAASKNGLPAMGYLHIDGLCQPGSGGSRVNRLEAETIAAWLAANKDELEAKYGKRLDQIVGVVTPFGGQVRAIAQACREHGINVGGSGGMTVGTVHSLQGAERSVVIFSPVYSKHADGTFIDKSPSMLNVAVSRAKDSFLVFGDMDVFERSNKSTPRGLLANYLARNPNNVLHFERRPRRDLITQRTGIQQLRDASEHDAFLLSVLEEATREVHIVTPWILLERVKEIGALAAMTAAVRRGVQVCIYTDPEWNTDAREPALVEEKRRRLHATAETLGAAGIETIFVGRVHSKIVMADDNVYCVGSFNWFSASRDVQFARHETSLVYRGPDLKEEIEVMRESLRSRRVGGRAVTQRRSNPELESSPA